jgi:hypothetical protein
LASIRRNFYLAFAHNGCHPIPTADGNQLAGQQYLSAFVRLVHQILRPNNPNPWKSFSFFGGWQALRLMLEIGETTQLTADFMIWHRRLTVLMGRTYWSGSSSLLL